MSTPLTAFSSTLDLPVTPEQQERSLGYLQQAYAEGRITELELDQRVETVLRSRTRRELNRAFDGLARIPVSTAASLWRPERRPGTPTPPGRALAAVAHFSALGTWAVGPAIAYAVAPQHSYLRREAAKAFNFQVVTALAAVLVLVVTGGALEGMLMGAGALGWFLLTLAGAARAAAGEQWRNPVTRVVPLRLLDEGERRSARPALGR